MGVVVIRRWVRLECIGIVKGGILISAYYLSLLQLY